MRPIVVLWALLVLTGCVTGTRSLTLPVAHLADRSDAAPTAASSSRAPSTSPSALAGPVRIRSIRDARVFEEKPRDPSTPSVRGRLEDVGPEARARLIGRQRDSFGKAMGDLALAGDRTVEDEVRTLLVQGLEARGIRVADDDPTATPIDVTIDEFWAWFSPGMWAIGFDARLRTQIELAAASGTRRVEVLGRGGNRGQIESDANWLLAYQRAFDDYAARLSEVIDEWTR
ncbi:MAG: hypothetical protein IPK00_04440 [Deltaproteobacteria bacterium]|nr:hypothetical protein [Deltaproteobacteria bacterium]